MLMHIDTTGGRGHVRVIEGNAHIVIAIQGDGKAWLEAFFNGRMDSCYGTMSDARLFERELPKLIAELREQLQSLSGSTVTE